MFYCGLIGLEQGEQIGHSTVLCPGPHRAITLNSPHKTADPSILHGHEGLYHFSFYFSHHEELARVAKRFISAAYDVEGVFDYGTTLAVYLHDPDGIPVELYVERPKGRQHHDKNLQSFTKSIDLESFLKELL